MNTLSLSLISVATGVHRLGEGIELANIKYIRLSIDDCFLLEEDELFEYGLVVWTELLQSSIQGGKYLIFTEINGIADDGGWEYIVVERCISTVTWSFNRGDQHLQFTFLKAMYDAEIATLALALEESDTDLSLLPTHVFFPEE